MIYFRLFMSIYVYAYVYMSEFNVRWFYMARGPPSSEMLEQIIYMAVGYLGVE